MGLKDRIISRLVNWLTGSSTSTSDKNKDNTLTGKNDRILKKFMYGGFILGFVAVIVYASQALGYREWLVIFGMGIMFSGGSFLVGSLIGFLFGIPRALQHSSPTTQKTTTGTDASTGKTEESYTTNTNLEQISDWLTKILVGVGLTQLSSISSKISELAQAMGKAFGGANIMGKDQFAGAIFIYFSILGFLFCYLWTRLYLQRALEDPVAALSDKVQQAERDAQALAIVDRQLDRAFDAKGIDQKELANTIRCASQFVKAQVFSKAQTIRALNWEHQKPIMEKTIPVFRALIEIDTEGKYHRNYAELGYALKDQRVPEYEKAKEALTTAIKKRGDWKTQGWLFYEFNRAICTINLDPNFTSRPPTPSEGPIKEEILADLRAAASADWLRKIIVASDPMKTWMILNGNPDLLESPAITPGTPGPSK
jgi:hypothetical protein